MIRYCQRNDESVKAAMRSGRLDAACSSQGHFVDDVLRVMLDKGILKCLSDGIEDRRNPNSFIPFGAMLALSVAAKMKIKTSLTDIPFAITDHRLLSELGYAMYDTDGRLAKSMMTEGTLRNFIAKYTHEDLFTAYNNIIQNHVMPRMDMSANIHILDCTKISVNYWNTNYEGAGIARDSDNNVTRGYKIATLRGIIKDSGIIEEIRWGSMDIHDLELSKDMLYNSLMLKPGDLLICDRGFISREVINYLKTKRGVDVIIPLRANMEAHSVAVTVAKEGKKWVTHPNKKRKNQKVAFVSDLGNHYIDNPKEDVGLNACVVFDSEKDEYFTFISTDLSMSAKMIVKTYELRPEIEESFRQIKSEWKIEDFKSTKQNFIAFHIICTLFGYLFWELFTMLPEGMQYARKSLPAILKNHRPQAFTAVICYVASEFAVFSLSDYAELYTSCGDAVKALLRFFVG